jgi:hypothetical protein
MGRILQPYQKKLCNLYIKYYSSIDEEKTMLFNEPNKTGGIQKASSKERSNKETKKNKTTNRCSVWVVRRNNILVGTCISTQSYIRVKSPLY